MTHVWLRLLAPLLVLAAWLLLAGPMDASAFQLFRTEEASIADIQAVLQARTLTCRALVQMYLDRIKAYDKQGPALNAIVTINADALKTADALDAQLAQSGPVGPLHCVPMIVKDNYDTVDMPTSAGSPCRDRSPRETLFRFGSCGKRAPSCWPRPTWRSSPSTRSRR
jgi:hypothetical protein